MYNCISGLFCIQRDHKPVDFTLASWKHILQDASLWRSCAVTAVSTILTVVLSIFVTALMSYPLSKNYFKAGRVLMIFVILTMIFKAPVVPYFLTLKNLGFYNNPIVLVIPHIFSAYNMAIMRTSFKAFPSDCIFLQKLGYWANYSIFLQVVAT